MNVIAIHLDKAAVRLGWDDTFQIFYLLLTDSLVYQVSQLCALRRRSWAYRRKSPFLWWPLSSSNILLHMSPYSH